MRTYPLLLLASLSLAPAQPAPNGAALARYEKVDAAPARTSIHIGSALVAAGRFVRVNGVYSAAYTAKVSPFSFWSEKGTLRIAVSDEDLKRLSRGIPIEFKGGAIRSDGRERLVEGRVTPLGPTTGQIKIRLIVNRYLVLVFTTTYRLPSG